jgi:hypothetical protein
MRRTALKRTALKQPPFKTGDTLDVSGWNNQTRYKYVAEPCVALNVVHNARFLTSFGITVKMIDGEVRTLDSGWFKLKQA